MSSELPDVQNTEPEIKMPIKRVGIQNLYVPFKLLRREDNELFDLFANVSVYVDLLEDIKGISMSRLVLTIKDYLDQHLSNEIIYSMIRSISKNLESKNSFVSFKFKLPKTVYSPITNNSFPMFYDCSFQGNWENGNFEFFQGVIVQYSSYCPCSLELSKNLKLKTGLHGAPHAQRSFANVKIRTIPPKTLWLEELIELVENAIKTKPYPIIKRADEQELARIAFENPIFVEDAIRQISKELNSNCKICDWHVKCYHEESIHSHEAVAENWKGLYQGFGVKHIF